MKNKVAILTSGHPPKDERIFWKFGISLSKDNYSVKIICSTLEINSEQNGISLIGFNGNNITKLEKITNFTQLLKAFDPEIIICCEAFTIIPSNLYKLQSKSKCKIIYDVTEWYPEGIVYKLKGIKKLIGYFILYVANAILSNLTNVIIIGEVTKKNRYDFITPLKKKVLIGYYPVKEFFEYSPPARYKNSLTLCYAGLINFKRGVNKLLKIAETIKERHNDLTITVKLVGRFESHEEEIIFDNLSSGIKKIKIKKAGWTDYNRISELISDADICFDLRERNFVYNNSLPIKIFEYMACGKPFIFSDIMPIRKELGEINCGFLVNPDDNEDIVNKIETYLSNEILLQEHSKNGRKIIESGKNWETESAKLLSLIEELIGNK